MYDTQDTQKGGRTITLRIPKISQVSAQTVILILLIAVGLLQTVQLFGLKDAIAHSQVRASSASTGGSGSAGAELPEMVGGC